MIGRYASDTTVPVERSRAELERILVRYGASSFAYAWEGSRVMILFQIKRYRVRLWLPLPDQNATEFRLTSRGQPRSPTSQRDLYEQACRQHWRALALVVKAKLEAAELGISTLENEFLSGILLPGGKSVGETISSQLPDALASGPLLRLLPSGEGER